ncbi:MAG TPA: CdaR family protein [Tissierellaceae bacterium]|nr:CdaR family protein [Tissierellaceae bacterium]
MGKEKNNLTLKIFALIISIILWSYVMSVENPYITREYKDVVVNLYNTSELERQGLVVMEPEEVKINVKVGGNRSKMKDFSSSDIIAEIDLSGYEEGQSRVGVDVSLTNSSSSITIEDYEPKEILFSIDKVITQEKSVGVEVEGELDSNYMLGDITTKPETVLIRGPRTWVNEVSEVKATIDVTDIDSDTNMTRSIQINDDNENEVTGLEKEPTVVDIDIPVLRKHTLPIELQTEGKLPEGYVLSNVKINPNSIAIKGDENIVNHTHINTKTININDLIDKTSMEVELDLPDDIELVNPDEKISISYTIEEIEDSEITYDVDDIDIKNLNDDLTMDLEDVGDNIKVNIEGTKKDLDNIDPKDLDVYIDLRDLEEGSHEVEIQIERISGVDIKSIDPKRLGVNIELKDEED